MTTPGPFSDECEREGKGVNFLALPEGKGHDFGHEQQLHSLE